jgi:hypothetical protein
MSTPKNQGEGNQGEGDRESDRRFREDEQAFVNSPRGKEAAKHAGDVSEQERKEIERAEREAGSHAHEHDPEEKVNFGKKS